MRVYSGYKVFVPARIAVQEVAGIRRPLPASIFGCGGGPRAVLAVVERGCMIWPLRPYGAGSLRDRHIRMRDNGRQLRTLRRVPVVQVKLVVHIAPPCTGTISCAHTLRLGWTRPTAQVVCRSHCLAEDSLGARADHSSSHAEIVSSSQLPE